MSKEIPYKIYLEESEMPKQWYNVRADMKNKPAPILNPATMKPVTVEELAPIFCVVQFLLCKFGTKNRSKLLHGNWLHSGWV